MTVTSVIPEAPDQSPSLNRSFKGNSNQSKDFYNHLRSSAHDNPDPESHSVRERAKTPQKREKMVRKATGKDETANDDDVVQSQQNTTKQAKPPISIEALLGLPTVPKIDIDQTGIAANNDGPAALFSNNSSLQNTANKGAALLGANFASLNSALRDEKLRQDVTDPSLNPAFLLNGGMPQALTASSGSVEDGMAKAGSTPSSVSGSEGKETNVEILTAGGLSDNAAANQPEGNLAFALRLNDGETHAKDQVHSPDAPILDTLSGNTVKGNQNLSTAVQAAAGSQLEEQSHHGEKNGSETNSYQIPQTQSQNISDSPHTIDGQPAQTAPVDLQAKQDAATTEPVRNVHVQLVSDNSSRVDVRLVERGGELHVSVKSADVNLAQNLQEHMPELTSRLEQQRFQPEVWMPRLGDHAKAEMSGTRDFSAGGNNSGNSDNNSDRQGKGQQQYRPDWVDVLENSTRGTGKVNPTWQQ